METAWYDGANAASSTGVPPPPAAAPPAASVPPADASAANAPPADAAADAYCARKPVAHSSHQSMPRLDHAAPCR